MTEPGPIEKAPIKVVPMYIEPDPVLEADAESTAETIEVEPERQRRTPVALAGWLALAASVLAIVADAAAIVTASGGDYAAGTVLAWVAIVLTVIGFVGGIVAAILGRGRRWGVIAAILAVLANPWIMRMVLEFVAGTTA